LYWGENRPGGHRLGIARIEVAKEFSTVAISKNEFGSIPSPEKAIVCYWLISLFFGQFLG
jgi:hypothetical protein